MLPRGIRFDGTRYALGVAIALLLAACTTPVALPQPSLSTPSGIHPSPRTVVAEVDGEAIYREEWQRALALDRAMSALAGRSLPTPEESLQRLINERLTLREARMASFTATPDQAAARLQTLLRRWNKDELALDAALAEHDLSRADVLDAIRRLLIVESYFAHLGSQTDVQRWMAERRQRAKVGLYVSFSVPPTPSVLTAALPKPPATPLVLAPQGEPTLDSASTPSPQSVYERAPDPTPVPSPTALHENPALDFTLPDLDGRPTTLSQFRGRIVVLNFWASWCPSCRAEARDFGDFARQYRDRGVTVVGVNLREDVATVRNFAESNGMDYPLLLDADGVVGRMYEVVGIPTTVIIDAAGGVRGRHVGVLNAAQLAAYVAPLLTESPSTERLAPDFTLPREDGRLVSLRDYLGRQPVVLLFYRSAGCGSCQQQLRAMQAEYGRFRARGAEVLAIAVQGVTQASVVRELGQLEFPVLADEAHTVSEAFGVFNRLGDGLAAPSVFVIDEGGRIIWSHIGRNANDYPAPSDILNRVS